MRKTRFLICFILIFFMISSCSALHSQGLEWNYGEGIRYDFRELYYRGDNETLDLLHDWTYYLIAPDYYEFDDPLMPTSGVPSRTALTYWPNGSEMQTGRLQFAVPIGNWSLLSSLVEGMSDDVITFSTFETDTIWGYEQVYSTNISSNSQRGEFAKPNGVLTKMTLESTVLNHHLLIVIEQIGISPVIIQLGVTITGAVSIALILLVYHRTRK